MARRRYLDLQKLARQTGRPTDELLQLYALEGFLDRLIRSPHASRFVLKGGVLMAAFEARRPTRDVDFAGLQLTNDADEAKILICEIAASSLDDGLEFDTTESTADVIRQDDAYSGVRVGIAAQLSTARMTFHVDVNVGDPIWPAPHQISLPRLLGNELAVLSYPLSMVYAEKLVTSLQRGTANTRWRDFVDIATLARTQPIDAKDLTRSLSEVAAFRGVTLGPLTPVLEGYPAVAQVKWAGWRQRQRLQATTPAEFATLLEGVLAFADPVMGGKVDSGLWNQSEWRWDRRPPARRDSPP
jgi:hypothetical protein